ncbi:MAG: hypothetical protein WD342_07715 [Verrucomicrobiales bacterium]
MIDYWLSEVSDFVWDMRDFFPTACDLAGADPPENLDGIFVVPTLKGKEQEGREFHYWEIHSSGPGIGEGVPRKRLAPSRRSRRWRIRFEVVGCGS